LHIIFNIFAAIVLFSSEKKFKVQ